MKKTNEVDFKETYPIEEKKFVIFATISSIVWQGDIYLAASPKFAYCCEEVKTLEFKANNIGPGFLKILYNGEPVDECPFCMAKIEVITQR